MEYRPEKSDAQDSFGTGRRPKQPPYPLMAGMLLVVLLTVNLLPIGLHRLRERVTTAATATEQTAEATIYLPEKINVVGECTSMEFEISPLDEVQRRYWDLPEGVMIGRVPDDSAAYAAGLRAGDLLTAIEEQPVTSMEDYHRIMDDYVPGERLLLECYRDGQFFAVELTVSGD